MSRTFLFKFFLNSPLFLCQLANTRIAPFFTVSSLPHREPEPKTVCVVVLRSLQRDPTFQQDEVSAFLGAFRGWIGNEVDRLFEWAATAAKALCMANWQGKSRLLKKFGATVRRLDKACGPFGWTAWILFPCQTLMQRRDHYTVSRTTPRDHSVSASAVRDWPIQNSR